MKKILFIITQSEFGGAQKFLYEFVSRLDRDKYGFLIATGKDGDGKFSEALKNAGIITQSLHFLRRRINPYYDFKAVSELRNLIKKFNPDVLFLLSSKAGVIGSFAAREFPGLKVIYRIGGWSFNDPLPWPIRLFFILAEKCTAKDKDYIIVNNEHDFEQAKRLKIKPRQSLELIYNGIDPYRLDFLEKNEAKTKLAAIFNQKQKNFSRFDFVIGTIANFYKTKGLVYLVRAAKIFYSRNPSVKTVFVLIGDGSEKSVLEAEIKNSGLENSVFLAGAIPDAYKYLPAMDIFVLPSVKEGFPWALLEAMSAKLPVIATRVGANPEIIENRKNGILIEPGKPEEIASALTALAKNEDLRRELGIQAHQTVAVKFDQNKMINKIESLF